MRILVIGGTRFIGPWVVRALTDDGHEVAVFHRGETRAELPDGVREILGDHARLDEHARDFAAFAPDVVLHMVAMTDEDAERAVRAFAGRAGRMVAISSMDVYRARNRLFGDEPGDPDPVPLTEASPLREVLYPYRSHVPGPEHPWYAYEKILVERAVLGADDLRSTVLRLPAVYGPGDNHHRIREFLDAMDDGRPAIPLTEGRAQWRWSRGHVANVARAITLAVEDERAAGEVYNVADEPPLTDLEWVRAIGSAAGWEGEVVVVPDGSLRDPFGVPLDFRQHLVGSTKKIREQLGFAEAVPLADGLRAAVEWERAHPPEARPPRDYAAEDAALARRPR
jgi:nucleoside-diphosphate-sugar epimerase